MAFQRCPECRVIDGHMRDCSRAGNPSVLPSPGDPSSRDARPPRSGRRPTSSQEPSRNSADRAVGRRNMLVGGLWFLGGALVTGLSLAAASSRPDGGRYYLAIGALVFGAAQFFKGLAQTIR